METLSEYLESKRKDSGLSIEDIARVTKIRPVFIKAIEEGDFSSLPSPHLLKGYVRLISKAVNADSARALELAEPHVKKNLKERKVEDLVGNRVKEERIKYHKIRTMILISLAFLLMALAVLFISLKAFYYFKSLRVNKPSSSAASVQKGIGGSANFFLEGKVVQKTWIAVKVDNKPEETFMLYAGDKKIWKAKNHIYIKIGNAGGIILDYNGKRLGKPGAEREVVTLNFPRKSSG